jgi:tetratricopeptide (TPR) repeat protein
MPSDLVGKPGRYGPVPDRVGKIFRDRYDLEAGHSLNELIDEALKESEALIVLCSPASAKSPYVGEEIARFKALGRSDRVYGIIIGGEPGHPEFECFHPNLRRIAGADGRLTDALSEPLAADMRAQGDGEELATLKTIAGVMGVDLDELRRREAEEQRRQKRFWIGLSAGMAIVTGIAVISSFVAWREFLAKQTALSQNEKLLAKTLKRAQSLLEKSVTSSDQFGLPVKVSLDLLDETSGIFNDMDEIKQASDLIPQRRADLLITYADMYAKLGEVQKQAASAAQARDIMTADAAAHPTDKERQHLLADAWIRYGHANSGQRKLADALVAYETGVGIIETKLGGLSATNPEWLSTLAVGHQWIATTHRRRNGLTVGYAAALKSKEAADRLAVVGADPLTVADRLVSVLNLMSDIERSQGKRDDARSRVTEAIAIARKVQQQKESVTWRRREANLLLVLGDIDRDLKRFPAAMASYQAAFDIREQLLARDPKHVSIGTEVAFARVKLGEVYAAAPRPLGDIAKAAEMFEAATIAYEGYLAASPQNLSAARLLMDAYDGIGDIHERRGQYALMRAVFERKLNVAQRIYQQDTANSDSGRLLGQAYLKMGEADFLAGQFGGAVSSFEQALGHYRRVFAANPISMSKRDLATSIEWLGRAKFANNDIPAAMPYYREAWVMRDELIKEPTSGEPSHRLLAGTTERLAEAELRLGEVKSAADRLGPAIVIRRRQMNGPPNEVYTRDLASALELIGSAQTALGNVGPALLALDEARSLRVQLLAEEPDSAQKQRQLAMSWHLTGVAQAKAQDCAGASLAFSQAIVQFKASPPERAGSTILQQQLEATEAALAGLAQSCPPATKTVAGAVARPPVSPVASQAQPSDASPGK